MFIIEECANLQVGSTDKIQVSAEQSAELNMLVDQVATWNMRSRSADVQYKSGSTETQYKSDSAEIKYKYRLKEWWNIRHEIIWYLNQIHSEYSFLMERYPVVFDVQGEWGELEKRNWRDFYRVMSNCNQTMWKN